MHRIQLKVGNHTNIADPELVTIAHIDSDIYEAAYLARFILELYRNYTAFGAAFIYRT